MTQILVEEDIHNMERRYENGKMGDEITWPECLDNKGKRVGVSKIRGPCEKTWKTYTQID
jgi:hypothetical protein